MVDVVDVQHRHRLKTERGTARETLFQPQTLVTLIVNNHAAVMRSYTGNVRTNI